MIKESFLRNYSLSKLYHQAEDQKNKLKVFYMRKLRNIMREKQEKERLIQRQKISRENREERMKRKFKNKVKTEFNQHDASYKQDEVYGRSLKLKQNTFKERNKTELKLMQIKFNTLQNDEPEFILRNQKLKTLRIRLNNSITHSQKTNENQMHLGQSGFLRKNTINQSIINTKFENQIIQIVPKTCRNQSIIFFPEQNKQSKRKLKFLNKVKERHEIKRIITKMEPKIVSNI